MSTSKSAIVASAKKALKSGEGMVAAIKDLHKKGFENSEIINLGFNKNTVYRQVREFKREREASGGKKAPAKK